MVDQFGVLVSYVILIEVDQCLVLVWFLMKLVEVYDLNIVEFVFLIDVQFVVEFIVVLKDFVLQIGILLCIEIEVVLQVSFCIVVVFVCLYDSYCEELLWFLVDENLLIDCDKVEVLVGSLCVVDVVCNWFYVCYNYVDVLDCVVEGVVNELVMYCNEVLMVLMYWLVGYGIVVCILLVQVMGEQFCCYDLYWGELMLLELLGQVSCCF